MNSPAKVLIQGIGNPLRSDDALGPMLIERLEASKLAGNQSTVQVELEWVYQLQIENAEQWSHFDVVILVDAHASQSNPVNWVELKTPQNGDLAVNGFARNSVASHALDPLAILCLAEKCYQNVPRAYLLSICGHNFEMGTELSNAAQDALGEAEELIRFKLSLFKLTQSFEKLGNQAIPAINMGEFDPSRP
ncbi:MAG: hydrogenase maturation protease [Deltaproteobacteria bacterium]|jgi:hydrogenase maturation protease|nr:hydrogenase maturation protease [Deltaproteobacteria bacterium]